MEADTTFDSAPKPLSVVTALLVEDNAEDLGICKEVGEWAGLRVRTAATTEEALTALEEFPIDIVLTDLRVPEMGGMALLRRVRSQWPHVSVIVLTQYGTIDTALEATRLGAADYVTKPFHIDDLRAKLQRVAHSLLVDQENRILREQLRTRSGFGGMIGLSVKMQRVYRLIEKVSQHNYPVLILGESGTGKEIVASSIHFLGPRKHKPFMPVDCSALVPSLIESELFGYVKGAFTGAQHNKQGLLETAEEGTLFLDEIGDMPVDLQAKLLRALQEHEIKPVGSTVRVAVRARIIAATNRDLETAIRNGAFRQDLYFRLNVVQIKIPPLRERKTDIPLLANAFLEKFADGDGAPHKLSEEALRCLMAYDWPGNVRELENAIERAVALGPGPNLQLSDLPSSLHYGKGSQPQEDDKFVPLDTMERRAIFRALQESGGDKVVAARMLGIGKTTLYRKLKYYESHPATPPPQ
ncbi:MAG TPA: sigma-54 dependent transcriptional regulator [Candidatus Acidoferrum sp.]|nr:sigma-54 dependent transcriptional regulator [Candidatus Acidoferrum sp.]